MSSAKRRWCNCLPPSMFTPMLSPSMSFMTFSRAELESCEDMVSPCRVPSLHKFLSVLAEKERLANGYLGEPVNRLGQDIEDPSSQHFYVAEGLEVDED
ncbi:unnamed protein product [Heligmosomoides polygyrus]|uniref:DUF1908 domain-containing protein n=1 Tax=Heligmosomoides polygyrus TaxID=6339 RepID=A0A183GKU6_HELPZ|nr:unnamed protein product [Heligmosomoides polygyrus]